MKGIIFTLLLPLVLAEYPPPRPRNYRQYKYKIVPSIQTSLQLQRQQASVPHTVYGPPPVPKTIESLDLKRPVQIFVNTANNFQHRPVQQQVPRDSYGVPVLSEPKFVYSKPERNIGREPCSNNQNNNRFNTNDKLINQRLPSLEAQNFNQEFKRPQIATQPIPATPQSNFNVQPRFPNNNVNVENQNTNFQDVPVVLGTNTSDNFDETLNQNEVITTTNVPAISFNSNQLPNDKIPNNFNTNSGQNSNTESPTVYYYLPPPVPSTARPVLKRRPTTTTTTEAPLEESEEEATDEDENTRRPQVAIANAFAGLYYPQQPTKGSRILGASQTGQSAQPAQNEQPVQTAQPVPAVHLQYVYPQYSSAYQLQTVQAYPQHIQPYYSLNLPIVSQWRK